MTHKMTHSSQTSIYVTTETRDRLNQLRLQANTFAAEHNLKRRATGERVSYGDLIEAILDSIEAYRGEAIIDDIFDNLQQRGLVEVTS